MIIKAVLNILLFKVMNIPTIPRMLIINNVIIRSLSSLLYCESTKASISFFTCGVFVPSIVVVLKFPIVIVN